MRLAEDREKTQQNNLYQDIGLPDQEIAAWVERGRRAVSLSGGEVTDEQVQEAIWKAFLEEESLEDLSLGALRSLCHRVFLALREDLYVLSPYGKDEDISDIMVNGREAVFLDKGGQLVQAPVHFESDEALYSVIRRLVSKVGREINELHPIVDARMEDGSRVNAVYGNVALGGPALTIRRFPKEGFTMEDLIAKGTITKECADFLSQLVQSGYNIFICGGTSSGKTTFLNTLTDYIPREERVVVIEDSAELSIRHLPNIVRLECRQQNMEGRGKISMADLIRTSLRMRPDRIIVGEVRGGEVVDMINAMNTGHPGSLSTGHGNSIGGMLRRLESMFLQETDFPLEAIRGQILEGIDIFVHVARLRDRRRVVLEVAEILEEKGQPVIHSLYTFRPEEGLVPTGNTLQNRSKWDLYAVTGQSKGSLATAAPPEDPEGE